MVNMLEHEKQIDEIVRNMDNKMVESIESISPKEMISISSFGEVVDFRGIGKVEKDFIPLLEEVCSLYPSLIDTKKRRSQRFTEWAFTALGRVLHFLNTKKMRDMDDDACNHLQTLWEELEICGFDLSWLKPRVDRVLEMKRLEKNVTILEMEAKTLMTKLIEAKVNLEIARRLKKVKEDSKECDLEAELRYGGGEKDLVRMMSNQETTEAETAEGRAEQLKENLSIAQFDLDKALKINSELNAKLNEMIIAHADCEKKQEVMAAELSEARAIEKRAIETGRKLQKNNDDLTLDCEKMKNVIKELNQQKAKVVQKRVALSATPTSPISDPESPKSPSFIIPIF